MDGRNGAIQERPSHCESSVHVAERTDGETAQNTIGSPPSARSANGELIVFFVTRALTPPFGWCLAVCRASRRDPVVIAV